MHSQARNIDSIKDHPITVEIAQRLIEKSSDINREFNNILDIAANFGGTSHLLKQQAEICHKDITSHLPYKNETFDLILNNLELTSIDDINSTLLNTGRLLKRDGLMLASILGAESFKEVKESFYNAGSSYGHVSLLPDVKTCGDILHKLQFAIPVVDKDIITLHYPDFKDLWNDIRLFGKLNNHPEKLKGLMTPSKWQKMEEYYWNTFSTKDGLIPLTLEVIYLSGWRADKSQQKPLPMGTKAIHLSEVLK